MNGMYVQMILGAAMLLSIVVLDASREVLRLENRGGAATFVVAMGSHGRTPASTRNAQQQYDRRAAAVAMPRTTTTRASHALAARGTADPHGGMTVTQSTRGTGAAMQSTTGDAITTPTLGRPVADPSGTSTAALPQVVSALALAMQSVQVL
jgi:hypothetical protein